MARDNVDWAFSRERYWGTPLPVWRCEQGTRLHRLVRGVGEAGGGAAGTIYTGRYIDEVKSPAPMRRAMTRVRGDRRLVRLRRDAVCPVALPVRERGVSTSGSRGLHLRGGRPDARLVLLAARRCRAAVDGPSYRNVLCLGLILDREGQKMSKSRGNVVLPWAVIDQPRRGRVALVLFTSSSRPATASRSRRSARARAVLRRCGTRTRSSCCTRTSAASTRWRRAPRRRGRRSTAGCSRAFSAGRRRRGRARRLRPDGGRAPDRGVRGRSLELVRAPQPAAFSSAATPTATQRRGRLPHAP